MRKQILESLESYFVGNINKHKMNVEMYLSNPVGIGEHGDIMEAIEDELAKVAEYNDKLGTLRGYFDV